MNPQENPVTKNLDFSEADHFFKTIGEVSAEIGIPPHVLRFWESKFFRIKPHKRKGGHRYYSKVDVEAIHQIKKLLYEEGYTIKGAQKFLREKGYMQQGEVVENHTVEENNSREDQQSLFTPQPELKRQTKGASIQGDLLAEPVENILDISNNQLNAVDPRAVRMLLSELESIKKILVEK